MIYKNKLRSMRNIAPHLDQLATVLLTGAFDIAHNGHTRYLRKASEQGEPLIVGLHSDDLIEKRKGRKPVHNELERAEMLSCFDFVDYIFILENEEDLDKAIRIFIKPHTIVVSETTEDEAFSPANILKIYGKDFYVRILPAQSDEHSSDYIKVR
jgi:cytidyltransferase-like protein